MLTRGFLSLLRLSAIESIHHTVHHDRICPEFIEPRTCATDGVHHHEFIGIEPVAVLKAVRVTGAAYSDFAMDQFLYVLFYSTPKLNAMVQCIGAVDACDTASTEGYQVCIHALYCLPRD